MTWEVERQDSPKGSLLYSCEVQAKFSVLSSMRVAATILLLALAPAHGLVVSPAARASVATAKPTVARCGTNPEMFIG